MQNFSALAMGVAMIAALLLLIAGIRLVRVRYSRTKGILMIIAAAVIVMNVMIWTV
jgi:hypothetical protein